MIRSIRLFELFKKSINWKQSNNDITISRTDIQKYPQLIFHTWIYGIVELEARKKAHDFVRNFLSNYSLPPIQSHGEIPRKIWVYWDQGWDTAPDIVLSCRRSIEKVNSNFELNFIDYSFVKKNLDIPEKIRLNLKDNKTTFSDIVRCALLSKYGGIWMDATCYATLSMEHLLRDTQNRYFSYTRIDRQLSSWLMVSPANHIIPKVLMDVQISWWSQTTALPAYFWIHYLFEAFYNEMPEFRDSWSKRLYISGQSTLLASIMNSPFDEDILKQISAQTYVQKLSYKAQWAINPIKGSFAWQITKEM